MLRKLVSKDSLAVLLFLQFVFCATLFLDIPVARQVIGFFFLTFVPGYIIVKLLKLSRLDGTETIVFSVGLSIAFLFLTGLFVNELYPLLLGISRPLSLTPLMITFNLFVFVGAILVYLRDEDSRLFDIGKLRLSPLSLPFLALPILSIVGATWVNIYANSLILLIMIPSVALLFVLGVISKRLLPPEIYPIAIFLIALSLLYHASLISNYLVPFGSDVLGENFAANLVGKDAYWSLTNPYPGDFSVGRTYAMLSVTILPAIYSTSLNLNIIWVFKLVNPVIFSLVPLGLYTLWRRFVGDKYALISVFLFMAFQTFYSEMLGLNKQMIGELFFVLLLLVVLNKNLKTVNKAVCFSVFSFALIVSHYALAEIFLFFSVFVLASLLIMKQPSKNVTVGMIISFSALMFSWYLYTSGTSVFDSFVQFGTHVYSQLGEFFNIQARGSEVLRGLALETPPTIWNAISRLFAYLTELFIFLGFVVLIAKRAKIRVEKDYLLFTVISMALLFALILIPGLASTLNMNRFYQILLMFIAPLCVIGVEGIVNLLSKQKVGLLTSILLLIVLVPYFLFQTGFVYEITRSESWSIPLSKQRMNPMQLYDMGYADAHAVLGSEWLSRKVDVTRTQIYADSFSRRNELRGYGLVYLGYVATLSNTTSITAGGIVYLSPLNVVEETVVGDAFVWNSSEIQCLHYLNKIYSNGGSEVYKNEP